jgi:hypothetical protein
VAITGFPPHVIKKFRILVIFLKKGGYHDRLVGNRGKMNQLLWFGRVNGKEIAESIRLVVERQGGYGILKVS